MSGQLPVLSYDDALALATLLDIEGAPKSVLAQITADQDAHRAMGRALSSAHMFVATLPPWQWIVFNRTMEQVWPKPQRHQSKPRDVHGHTPIRYIIDVNRYEGNEIVIDSWTKAWAWSIYQASRAQAGDNVCLQVRGGQG